MARPQSTFPTELELVILKVLWQQGAQTVEEVREALAAADPARELAHSSVITVMNIMVRKKYLSREKAGRAFRYQATVSEQQTNRGMLGDLTKRLFGGSASALMLELIETAELDAEEIKEIRRLINRKAREA